MRIWLVVLITLYIHTLASSLSALHYTTGINNPNAQTEKEKSLALSFMTYDQGGVQNKILISLFDQLDLGFSWSIHRAIGDSTPEFNAPGPVVKWKITEGSNSFPIFISLGYDAFFAQANLFQGDTSIESTESHINDIYFGPFLVITKPIYLFEFEQFFHVGWKMPAQPYHPDYSSFFIGFDIPIGPNFIFQMEWDQLFLNPDIWNRTMFHLGFRYITGNNLSIALYFMLTEGQQANRVLQVDYHLRFQ